MIRIHPYSSEIFEELVGVHSNWADPRPSDLDQVRYLGSYLARQTPPARWIVVEQDYVDRHYLEEYTGYYGTKLNPPPPKATRMHFFTGELHDLEFSSILEEASGGSDACRDVCGRTSSAYLGYTVIRPLPAAPIGRTIFRPYPAPGDSSNRRCFAPASTVYDVHLAGLALSIQGLPFQQQEQAVGACATTAIWSALARVVRMDGGRAPTPFAVTAAANRHLLSDRVFPAVAGLELGQMLSALQAFGYSPYVRQADLERFDLFKLTLKCYLRSGIPVILRVQEEGGEYHAVTVAGFREEDDEHTAKDIKVESQGSSLHALGLSRLYLHDDRLGPYARATWIVGEGTVGLEIMPFGGGSRESRSRLWIHHAIVPHYPKVRLTAPDLIEFAGQALPIVTRLLASEIRDEVRVDLRFAPGQHYLADLFDSTLSPSRTAAFVQKCRLSRYIGIARFSVGDEPFVDVLYDTTDIRRDADPRPPILAFVPFWEESAANLRELVSTRYEHAQVA